MDSKPIVATPEQNYKALSEMLIEIGEKIITAVAEDPEYARNEYWKSAAANWTAAQAIWKEYREDAGTGTTNTVR